MGMSVFPAPPSEKKSHKSAAFSGGRRWGATSNPIEIGTDFTRWPDANVGIACGPDSGIFVVECDTPKGHGVDGIESMAALIDEHGPLPETVEALSPTGSWHIYFRWPEAGNVRNSEGRVAQGIDVRGEGGMVIAPPSIRPGHDKPYRWKNPPDQFEVAECPTWLLDLCRRASGVNGHANGSHAPRSITVIPHEGTASDSERAFIIDRLKEAPNNLDRTDWIKLCNALKASMGDDGRDAWITWCLRWPDQKPGEPERVWDTARPDGSAGIGTVLAFLQAEAPLAPIGDREIFTIDRRRDDEAYDAPSLDMLVNQPPRPMPDVAHFADGVLSDTLAYISEGLRRDWPDVAFVIALQVAGITIGRNYETWTRLRSNLYAVALAESGFSKSSAIEPAKELLIQAGLQDMIGAERIKSDSGLIQSLFCHPEHKKIFFLDEYGHMLQQCTSKGAGGHVRQILVEFTNLYSKANAFYAGSAYADGSRTSEMMCPHVNVFGMATPGQFWAAFGSGAIEDGTLARFSIVKPIGRPVRREPDPDKLEKMRLWLAPKIAELAGKRSTKGNLGEPDPVRVMPSPEARAAWIAIGDTAEEVAIEASENLDKDIGGILARVAETAAKVALILAVTRNPDHPVISEADIIVGRRLAWWFAHVAIEGTMVHIADTIHQANQQAVLSYIKDGEGGQRTRSDVCRKFRRLTPREIDDVIRTLINSDLVASDTDHTGGRARTVLTAIKP